MLFEQGLEEGVRTVGIFLRLLQFQDITGEDAYFGIYIQFLVDQGSTYLFFGSVFVAGCFVVVGHRYDIVGIGRVDLMRFVVVGTCFYRVVLFQMKVAQDDLVTGFHRVFGCQLLYLLEGGVRLLQRIVELVLLHGEGFVHADRRFEGVVGVDSLSDLAFLGQGFRQVIVELRLSGIGFEQFLVFFGGLSVHT